MIFCKNPDKEPLGNYLNAYSVEIFIFFQYTSRISMHNTK